MRNIYVDHSATTPVFPEVADAVCETMLKNYGNPSSLHGMGQSAKAALEKARTQVGALINAPPEDVFFTSGGTESDNLAILGIAHAAKKGHIITGAAEHHAVLDTVEFLAKNGFDITILPVDQYGMVSPDDLKAAIRTDTILVSVMHANNEVGTVNPIEEIAAAVKEAGLTLHIDAVQSAGKIPLDAMALGVDLLTVSSHKINGPKGVGALYRRKGTNLQAIFIGGGQEKKLRSGTENMPGIVGFGMAAELTQKRMAENAPHYREIRDYFAQRVLSEIPYTILNGHPAKRLPHNVNISFDYIEGEALLLLLNLKGVCCSSGSACSSGISAASHVLTAMGLPEGYLNSAIRFSFGFGNTMEDADEIIDILKDCVQKLRAASPYTR